MVSLIQHKSESGAAPMVGRSFPRPFSHSISPFDSMSSKALAIHARYPVIGLRQHPRGQQNILSVHLVVKCNGPRSLPATEPDSRPGLFTVFPPDLIIRNGPRRQGFASPRSNGAPLTAPGHSAPPLIRGKDFDWLTGPNPARSVGNIVARYTIPCEVITIVVTFWQAIRFWKSHKSGSLPGRDQA